MSRIGNKAITIPAGVTVKIENDKCTVTGPLGTLTKKVEPKLTYNIDGQVLTIENNNIEAIYNAYHGLYRQIINNMIVGVTKGYEKRLTVNGVGYKITQKGQDLVLNIGFSHPVEVKAVEGIQLSCDKNEIIVKGIDKELVGQVALKIKDIKPVEPYHAYGIYYSDETIVRKEVKSGKK
ncbi:MAG: 50S ribosomal protein L6 [Clostridia bacterium]|nr:50S ribosomal protein L6 [Clostridia bacterium]